MENLFVSYEISLRLKQFGFIEKCLLYFEGKTLESSFDDSTSPNLYMLTNNKYYLTAPTYQQVIDWLRNEHNIILYVYIPNETDYFAHSLEHKAKYNEYYEALNKGIEDAFEIIENKLGL